jgi:ribosomal protein S18 acetylase RimI-like enzyme
MVETVTVTLPGTEAESPDADALAAAAQLLHDFNTEYDEPTPPPDELALRLGELIAAEQISVLLARAPETGEPVGVAVMRLQPSVWSRADEAYLAELYVVPSRRGQGFGRELIIEAMRVAREQGAEYAFLITSEDDGAAVRLYEAAGFRRTEGEGGPTMIAFERDL